MKRYYDELGPDPNTPGIRVCQTRGCRDDYDPWKLAPRPTEDISLKYPRPDVPLDEA